MSNGDRYAAEAALEIGRTGKRAFEACQLLVASQRVQALHEIRNELERSKVEILEANKRDLEAAQAEVDAGRMSTSLLSRLNLGKGDKWDSMLQGVTDVANLPDPCGVYTYANELDNGLELYRMTCPIGLLLVIFEARPEVVVNIATLAIKSGNAAILKGGKESDETTALLSKAIQTALGRTQIPGTFIQTVHTRAEVSALLAQDEFIDLVIPRGSNALVRYIKDHTRIPVMGHADGLCSVYLDQTADKDKAVRVVLDAKTDYPAACNAAEKLIVHEAVLSTVWPEVAKALLAAGVELHCDSASLSALSSLTPRPPNFDTHVLPLVDGDLQTEFLSLKISVITVDNIMAAINEINTNGSHHTDCIVTEDEQASWMFCRGVDSAGVYVNASTRFADGFRYGFGTEVGIATGKMHARGPVGLEGLVTYKYMLRSKGKTGHIVGEFGVGEGKKPYKHRKLDLPAPSA